MNWIHAMHRLTLSLIILLLSGCGPLLIAGTATGVSFVHDRRTVGTVVDDHSIELQALNHLSKQTFYTNSHISTISYNGSIVLVGQVPNAHAQTTSKRLVQKIAKVRKVYNELVVAKPISFWQRSRDSWLTGAVKTRLIADSRIDPTRIKVVTEDNTVYLMGLVSHDEALIATENAQKVSGVKRIIRLFEYLT